MMMTKMGVRDWVLAWLAFVELKGFFDHTSGQVVTLGEYGWFEGIGLFGSTSKRKAERVALSPFCFHLAYHVGGDPYLAGSNGNMTHPDKMLRILAERRGCDPRELFSDARVANGILQFNLDMGKAAILRNLPAIAVKRLTLAAEMGSAAAQFALGKLYADGVQARQDHLMAHKWLNLGIPMLSGSERDEALNLRAAVSQKLIPTAIVEAESQARQWSQKTWTELVAADPDADAVGM
jgi:hypothetical protein